MNSIRETVLSLVEISKTTWDFTAVATELRESVDTIQRDGTMVEISKRPLINIASVALKALDERQRSPQHLQQALHAVEHGLGELQNEQLEQLAAWFFKIAYSGNMVTAELERLIRPVLSRTQGKLDDNEKKFRGDFEMYSRLAEWGTDLVRSTNNLNGLLVAINVIPLKGGTSEDLRSKCLNALTALQARQRLSIPELARQSLAKCTELILPVWSRFDRGESCCLDLQTSRALHTCLFGLLETVTHAEELADVAQSMSEEINSLRARFEQIRYPSSTTLLTRIKQEIQSLDRKVDNAIDFDALKAEVADLQEWLRQAPRGTRGVNWMHKDHAGEALVGTRELFQKIIRKEQSPAELDTEFRLLEESIALLEQQASLLIASPLKRLMARVKRDAPLIRWVAACSMTAADRDVASQRIDQIRGRLRTLWARMESQQEQRITGFRSQCSELNDQIQSAVELRRMLSEIRELERCVDEFTRDRQQELRIAIQGLFESFKARAADTEALHQFIRSIFEDIDRSHRRIYGTIDFDGLVARTTLAKQWVLLRDFPKSELENTGMQVNRAFGEIRKLRFRQERLKSERQARADEMANELMSEIQEAVADAGPKATSPETWQKLVNADRRLREVWLSLTDAQRTPLLEAIDSGFGKIRAAREAFASEAAKVFSHYNDVLSDTLFALEEDATKDAAFEAIERIKPIRLSLRTENRLWKRQRDEIYALVSQISASIDEIFEQANVQATQDYRRIRADIDRLDGEVKVASNWQEVYALSETHKTLSAQIRDTDLNIASRKECRAEMNRIWDDIAERLRLFRFTRSRTEDISALFATLERQGHLMIVSEPPSIS